jgi:uncharacterized RDD family membrane protein YckC
VPAATHAAAAVASAAAPLELEVTAGPAAGLRLGLHEDFRAGSAESGAGALGGDRWLSPSHAQFHRGPDGWAIEDLRSLEGTQLNGRALRGAATLHVGDVIEVGCSRIVVLPHAHTSAAAMAAASPSGVARALGAESRRPLDGRRLLAFLIDSVLLVPMVLLVLDFARGRWVFLIVAVALALTYYFVCESLSGQTLGKRVMGLRVVRLDGRPLVPSAVAARTVLRLIDQLVFCLVGVLTILLTGARRQRLGDLAARTAVVRASTPAPRPEQKGRERLAFWAYPCMWIAPAVLFFVLVPDTRALPCNEVGITAGAREEGSCLVGSAQVLDVVNVGHTLRLPGFRAQVVGTATRLVRIPGLDDIVFPGGRAAVVGFRLAITNTGAAPLPFDAAWRNVELVASRTGDAATVPVHELPARSPRAFPAFARKGPIPPGRTATAYASFVVPRDVVPRLKLPFSGLIVVPLEQANGFAHVGMIRLWRTATPAGARALRGLRG